MDLQQLIASRTELSGERDTKVIASRLNERPMIPNPVTSAPLIPRPLKDIAEVFAIVQKEPTRATDMAVVVAVADMIRAGDTIGNHLGIPSTGNTRGLCLLMKESGMAQATYDAIIRRLDETYPDPSWRSEIEGASLAEQNGLGTVTPAQVLEAL